MIYAYIFVMAGVTYLIRMLPWAIMASRSAVLMTSSHGRVTVKTRWRQSMYIQRTVN